MPNRIIQYPVPLMLKKILKDQANGELIVAGRNFTKNLYFIEGKLTFARTTLIEERLGEILFKIGKIDRPQFMDLNRLIKEQNERLGKILVQKNILSQRDLFFALIYQMRTIATSTFELVAGEWSFNNNVPEIPEDSKFRIELPGIITEGMSKMGNISYFKNRFFHKSPRLMSIPRSLADVLSTNEMNFYKELNRFTNSSNQQVMTAMKVQEDVFWRKIAMLFLLNLVEFVDVSVDKELDANVEGIMRLYDQLKSDRMDFYQMLGVQNTDEISSIKNAYFNLAKKYHPDRIATAPDPDIKEKANFVFAEINKAYDTLSNVDKKREYDTRGYKETTAADSIQDNLAEKARLLYRRAKVQYTAKQYWEAVSTLDEAVALDAYKSSYFLLLGLCQMNLPTLRRRSANNLQKAIDLEPYNVEAYTAMGILFMAENQPKRAEGFFRKAISINPDHALARKKLAELGDSQSIKKTKYNIFGKPKK